MQIVVFDETIIIFLWLCSRDGGSSAGIFVGGFLLGGVVVGTLGCIYAPEVCV